MKKQLLILVLMMLPVVACAYDIAVQNGDGVTIYYNYSSDGTELAVTHPGDIYHPSYNAYTGNVVIPEEVTYMNRTRKVTSIDRDAFYGCSDLTSVTIPNSVTSIGSYAFYGCSGLTSVIIPNSVTSIGSYAFYQCTSLTSVTIPNSVKYIGDLAFYDCSGLTSVTIDSDYFLNNLSNLHNISTIFEEHVPTYIIGNSVTSIGESAFLNCTGLTSVIIPNSVTSIGNSAFYNCSGLTSITIGSGVTSIGSSAFYGADIPTIISLIENPSAITDKSSSMSTFSLNTFNNSTLYVPVGTIDKYKATEGWQDFENIVEGIPAGINVVEKTKNNITTIYDLNGVRQNELKRGVNIVNGKKVVVK